MATWKITYIDEKSRGKRCTTTYSGHYTRYEIIKFFGLDKPDVVWFKLELVRDNKL